MILKIPKQHISFSILYFLTITILLLDVVDNFVLGSVLRKAKYIYILIMFLWMCRDFKLKRQQCTAVFLVLLLIMHALLFGFVFTNPSLVSYTREHVKECLVFYLFVFLTYYYVSRENCFFLFVELSFLALSCLTAFASITNFSDFVNPIYYVNAFNESTRFRETFGFPQYGYVGNYCYCVIALSIILLSYFIPEKRQRAIIFILTVDFFAICMAFSAASRSSIVAICLTIFFVVYLEYFSFNARIPFRIIKLLVFMLIIAGLIWYCLSGATRGLNIEGNYPAFKQIGNFWTGMGYVESHGFQKDSGVFNVTTTSLDISYVYYYFSTGFIGCTIVVIFLLVCLQGLIRAKRNRYRNAVLSIFIGMLFYAYWQVNLLTYVYYSNFFYFVIYLTMISQVNNKKENIMEFV